MGTVTISRRRAAARFHRGLATLAAVTLVTGAAVSPATAALNVNLALNGTATATTSAFGSVVGDAIDGNRNGDFNAGSVYHSVGAGEESPLFYQADLGVDSYIDRVQILPRTDATGSPTLGNVRLTIYEDNGAGQPGNVTYTGDFLTGPGAGGFTDRGWGTTAPSLASPQGAHGRFVRLERIDSNYWITFSEFEVYGSKSPLTFSENNNIALGRPVTTSPDGPGFNAQITSGNDGNIDGNFGDGPYRPVYHSGLFGSDIFWQVELAETTPINHIELYTRMDGYSTHEFKVSVLNESQVEVSSYTVAVSDPIGSDPSYNLLINASGAIGKYIRVSPTGDQYLAFAELRAWAGPGITFLPGDFNDEGSVNGLDFNIWKGAFGAGGAGDADNDGDSDGADFLSWQRQVGGSAAVAAAGSVPEPASVGLALGAAAAVLAARRSSVWRRQG